MLNNAKTPKLKLFKGDVKVRICCIANTALKFVLCKNKLNAPFHAVPHASLFITHGPVGKKLKCLGKTELRNISVYLLLSY